MGRVATMIFRIETTDENIQGVIVVLTLGTGLEPSKKGTQLKFELSALNCWCRDQESNQGHTDFQS